ncbi:aminotransferase class I/II-fold pyridoxal phosphate-dependent enzyme [Candidatus Woesearchaeota archaeon]|nr:aminotransferase class I/II-fold pyridoxal phosphate-dependent enzyme [Candidatus Woesearchaeota archaeon]
MMGKEKFYELLRVEIARIDEVQTDKRHEKIISGFRNGRAVINGKEYLIFNSNDYLGLRHNAKIKRAEEEASKTYGAGPGAVRFISGTMQIHRDLEKALAKFHGREEGMIFSSAFAANMAVLHCIIKGQSRDSVVHPDTLVISDELNHRSIIDGIRVAGLDKDHKMIFRHMDLEDLDKVLSENKGKFKRVLIVTDGIFSMLGEHQDIGKMQEICDKHDNDYEEGIITVVDDSHGVAGFGKTGRGCEEASNGKCDLLVGTLGKGFGADGGYVVGDKTMVDYLRESSATYIYSNPFSPGTAGASLASVNLVDSAEGHRLLHNLNSNISYFKEKATKLGFKFACDSSHPIQPLLIGDTAKTKALTKALFEAGILVTNINFPVVPKGRDEIRVQISAAHSREELDAFIEKMATAGKKLGII